MKKRRRIVIIVLMAFVVYTFYVLITPNGQKSVVHSIPHEYSKLFSDSCLNDTQYVYSAVNKWRDTITSFILKNGYEILVCKLSDTTSISMDKYIKTEQAISGYSFRTYNFKQFGKCQFKYLPRELSPTDNCINFRYAGDSLGYTVKNKDRVYFNGSFHSVSICKGKSTVEDLVFYNVTFSFKLSIMFLNTGGSIYFIAMTPKYRSIKMDPKLLWNYMKI